MSHLIVFRIFLKPFLCFLMENEVFCGEQEKIHNFCEDGIEKSIPRDHCLSSLGLSILAHRIRISEILPWDRKSYLTHVILPRASSNGIMLNCIVAYSGTSGSLF